MDRSIRSATTHIVLSSILTFLAKEKEPPMLRYLAPEDFYFGKLKPENEDSSLLVSVVFEIEKYILYGTYWQRAMYKFQGCRMRHRQRQFLFANLQVCFSASFCITSTFETMQRCSGSKKQLTSVADKCWPLRKMHLHHLQLSNWYDFFIQNLLKIKLTFTYFSIKNGILLYV